MAENQILPKVLIYGETFKKIGGGGITLNTLFGDWPVDNIFMLSDRFGETSEIHFTHYYQLGNLENKSFLHKLGFITGNKSGSYEILKSRSEKTITTGNNSLFKSRLYFKLKNLFISFLNSVGLFDLFFQFKVSKELIQWIEKIKPDIIYFQPSTIQNIKFINELHQITKVPYVIHVMDNFLEINNLAKTLNSKNILQVERSIEELINNSNLCMGICEEMCYQYGKKFNRTFYPFQHAVDKKFWFKDYVVKDNPNPFLILYAGRISIGTIHSLFLLANSIDNCNRRNNCNFEFQIQTTSPVPKLLKKFSKYQCVKIHNAVPYNKLPERYAHADLLVLPMDFDEESLAYIKYSMPTKVPEYLISGVPIFVLAHEMTALYKYAKSENWAFTNSTEIEKDIENLLVDIRFNYKKRTQVSEIAKSIGKKNHDINTVRNSFKNLISESCYKVFE
jgi:glycosyltransferase involved in cell wall biosynthesis